MSNNQEKKYTVLVIEDNEINCELLEEILHDGYNLLFAHNGEEGMALLRQHYNEIEIILLDIQMPIMNGYEVLDAKGKDPLLKDLPVIITTGSDGKDDEVRCLELGAQDFIRKPYDPVLVRLRVENIINLCESAEANRQKSLFIHHVSHEIRTPINYIMGFAQILESMADSLSPEDLKTSCGNISIGIHALMDIVGNMTTLSDIDSGNKSTSTLSDVSPNKICREVIDQAAHCTQENVTVQFTSDVDDAFTFISNETLLKQALYNYITNAGKFTTQGEIRIQCSNKEKSRTLQISVSDTGIGVPSEKAEYIFERFAKMDSFVPGLGVGLSVTREIAAALGGSAYLDTTYSGGARFVLELPIKK